MVYDFDNLLFNFFELTDSLSEISDFTKQNQYFTKRTRSQKVVAPRVFFDMQKGKKDLRILSENLIRGK